MPRPIHLAIFSNSSRPAHHSIYIPSLTSPSLGKIIHVTGNPAVGFFLQFKRNYNISLDDRKYQLLELGMVDEKVVRDDKGGEEVVDTIARDRIEGVALGVEVPGKSSRLFGEDVSENRKFLGVWEGLG
jgi:hypothetical protein